MTKTDVAAPATNVPAARREPPFWQRALGHRSFTIGAVLSLLVALAALVSLFWTPHDAYTTDMSRVMVKPDAVYWLGTDQLGRDVFSMLMVGAQNSILVGVIAVSIGMLGGVALGLAASARRGWLEEALLRLTDFTFAFPVILVAILITAGWGPGIINSILAIGVYNIALFIRVTRGAANVIWAREFVTAARAAGKGPVRISLEHILPNILSVIVVQATIQFAIAILAEAALSYLGLGTQPPNPSWGKMLSENQIAIFFDPRLVILPGIAIVIAVLGLNLLGDGMRDLLDPRLVRKR